MKMKDLFSVKILFLTMILIFALGLSACGKKAELPSGEANLNVNGVPETGKEIDISGLNGQSATATPGDVLYLKFAGVFENGRQWDFTSPTSGDYLMLKNHEFSKTADPANPKVENYANEWRLKIEKTGVFDLQFDYHDYSRLTKKGLSGLKSLQTHKLNIISQ